MTWFTADGMPSQGAGLDAALLGTGDVGLSQPAMDTSTPSVSTSRLNRVRVNEGAIDSVSESLDNLYM